MDQYLGRRLAWEVSSVRNDYTLVRATSNQFRPSTKLPVRHGSISGPDVRRAVNRLVSRRPQG